MSGELSRLAEDLSRLLRVEAETAPPDSIGIPRAAPRLVPNAVRIERIAAEVRACVRCPLCRTRRQAVPGEGDPDSPLLIVGEAPGEEEDRQGRPFVGPAGQLLTGMLRAANMEREDVFIANVLKCRPPRNRDPAPNEVAECRRYLGAQIAAIRPKVILTLGKFSSQLLLDTSRGILALRGTPHPYRYEGGSAVLVPTLHPAYLLRQPAAKREAWEDVQTAHRLLREATGGWPPPIDREKVARLAREARGQA